MRAPTLRHRLPFPGGTTQTDSLLGIHLGVVLRVKTRAIKRGAGKQSPLQRAGRAPLFNAVAPESSVRAAGIDIVAGIHRDGFSPVQFGGASERPRRSGAYPPLGAERPDFGGRPAEAVNPYL